MLRTVQFHSQLCSGAIEIQNAISDRVLPAKFETRKTPVTQRPPERLFIIRLMAPQLPGDLFEAHEQMMFFGEEISSAPMFAPSPRPTRKAGMRSHFFEKLKTPHLVPLPVWRGEEEHRDVSGPVNIAFVSDALVELRLRFNFSVSRRYE